MAVKEYLLASTTKWQWAVNWLKKKVANKNNVLHNITNENCMLHNITNENNLLLSITNKNFVLHNIINEKHINTDNITVRIT